VRGLIVMRQQARNQRGAIARNFKKRMYLLGTAIGYIIFPLWKISVGCGPVRVSFINIMKNCAYFISNSLINCPGTNSDNFHNDIEFLSVKIAFI